MNTSGVLYMSVGSWFSPGFSRVKRGFLPKLAAKRGGNRADTYRHIQMQKYIHTDTVVQV